MLPVHMEQTPRPCPFMQIIHILRDDQQITAPIGIKRSQRPVGSIGLGPLNRFTPHVVESQHQFRIAVKGFGRRNILNPVLFPQTIFGAKCVDPAFGAYPRAGEDHDIAEVVHLAHEA